MHIDLHTHSVRSDGTDTPAELIANAAKAGLDVVALTDHDTTVGWAEAAEAADRHGIRLVCGIELSTRNQGAGQHLLGYGFDPAHPAIADMLQRAQTSREGRVEDLFSKLAELEVPVDRQEVYASVTPGGVPSRKHFAGALVSAGYVRDDIEAFDRFLDRGRPAYIRRYAPDIEETIQALRQAGGVAVIAHPWARGATITEARFAELLEAGLGGIEVGHQEHTAQARDELEAIARNLGLAATGSSDYHGTRKTDHDLGCNRPSPEGPEALLGSI